jgi:hypothetical protein
VVYAGVTDITGLRMYCPDLLAFSTDWQALKSTTRSIAWFAPRTNAKHR